MDRHLSIVAAVLAALAVGAAGWYAIRGGDPVGSPAVVAVEPPEGGTIVVHVSGWVAVPGLVEIPEGGRVADAVAAAGGARPGAALDGMNLAAPVHDGEQVIVPGPAEEATAGTDSAVASDGRIRLNSAVASDGRIRLNSATAAELDELPGVGPVLAERIVEHRDRNGPFATVEDLLDVPGIGERKLASLRDLVVVP